MTNTATAHTITVKSDRWAECACGIIFSGAKVAERGAEHASQGDADTRFDWLMQAAKMTEEDVA